jgi:hypothetical protein
MSPTSRPVDSFPDPEVYGEAEVEEFLDPWHPRASVDSIDGDHTAQSVVDPERVLDNITLALHRMDIDPFAPSPVGPATVTENELIVMLAGIERASALVAHMINVAVNSLVNQYPERVARAPFPTAYDPREAEVVTIHDHELDLARDLFNHRLNSHTDFDPADTAAPLELLDFGGRHRLLSAISVMYAHRLLALKYGAAN